MILVSIDCATGYMTRYSDWDKCAKPTHVLPRVWEYEDPMGIMYGFMDVPPLHTKYGRQLPLVIAA